MLTSGLVCGVGIIQKANLKGLLDDGNNGIGVDGDRHCAGTDWPGFVFCSDFCTGLDRILGESK